jgi:hypothetical protein
MAALCKMKHLSTGMVFGLWLPTRWPEQEGKRCVMMEPGVGAAVAEVREGRARRRRERKSVRIFEERGGMMMLTINEWTYR